MGVVMHDFWAVSAHAATLALLSFDRGRRQIQGAKAMSFTQGLWSALIALVVAVVMLAIVEILRRKNIRPVESIADFIAPIGTPTANQMAPVVQPVPTATTGNPV
jgi:hypothetical protein